MKIKLSQLLNNFSMPSGRLPTPPPDDETQDRGLKALRRLRRTQLERYEKEYLQQQVNSEIRKRDGEAFSKGYPIIQGPTGTQFKPVKKVSTLGKGNIL